MPNYKLSNRSKKALEGVHGHLVAVVFRALEISDLDFVVGEGLRSVERQKQLVTNGASETMNSRHLTGHAVDLFALVGGRITWQPRAYEKIADAMFKASAELGYPIAWGGSWKKFKDYVHFELNKNHYKGD